MTSNELNISPLITHEQIQKRITEIADQLSQQFAGQTIVAICVLRGAFMFYADLIRQIKADIYCDFLGAASYHNAMQSSGEVKLTLDLSHPLKGKKVLLVEDIVDTGLTMNYIKNLILARQPESLTTVTLLEKPEALKVPCKLDHVGFRISNTFVVGYGLDYQGHYRQLDYIAKVNDLN